LSASDTRSAPPTIGLTTYRQQVKSGVWDVPGSFLPAGYIEGVTRSGGIAVLLPPQPVDERIAERVIGRVDGLILTGGKDIDPAAYSHEPHPATEEPARDRDEWEFALLRAALRRRLPVLGICRGIQVINIALGGTLHQHLPDVIGHTGHRIADAVLASTAVAVLDGSRLEAMVGPSAEVLCYHHQAIDRVGAGLVVSAVGGGAIEAVELAGGGSTDHDFLVGVQWHPEEKLEDLGLFAGLVDAARIHATAKGSA